MVMLNLNTAHTDLAHAKTPEGKEAISRYIRLGNKYIVEFGKDTAYWPESAIIELMKAGRNAHEIAGNAERQKKAQNYEAINLADFMWG